jgi:hypothetical protein
MFVVVYVLDRQFPTSTNIISVKGMHAHYSRLGRTRTRIVHGC